MNGARRAAGITLVELVIVLAIVAALAAIGVPAYRAQVMDARRPEGRNMLLEAANRQEAFFARMGTYAGTREQLDYDANGWSENAYYQLSITGLTPTDCDSTPPVGSDGPCETYVLTAMPVNSQAADVECGALSLGSTGAKRAAGSGNCW